MKLGKTWVCAAVLFAMCLGVAFFSGCKKHVHSELENTPWQSDEDSHRKVCSCGQVLLLGGHSDEDENEKCDYCDYAFKPAPLATAQQMEQVKAEKFASAGGAVTAHPGSKVTVTIAITNGTDKRISVNVADTLPDKAVFVDGCTNVSGKNLSWEVKNIFPGQTKTVSYTFKPDYTVKQVRAASGDVLLKGTAAKVMDKETAKMADIYVLETFNATDRRRMEMAIDALVTANLTAYNSSLQQHNRITLASMMYTVGFSTGLGMPTDLDEILTLIYEKAGENAGSGSTGTGEENAVQATNLLDRVVPTLYGGTAVSGDKDKLFRGTRAAKVEITDLISGDLILVNKDGSTKLYIVDGAKLVELGKDEVIRKIDPATVLPNLPSSSRYVVLRPSINLNTHYSLEEGEYFNEADKTEYTELENALIKTAETYLLRGDRTQYTDDYTGHSVSRAQTTVKQPEDYTVDQYGYTNCAAFTYDVHWATSGVAAEATSTGGSAKPLNYTLYILDSAKRGWNPNTLKGSNASTVYYYECPTEVVGDKIVSTLSQAERDAIMEQYISLLRPGDVICYRYHPSLGSSGHAMLYVGNGLIIHSSGSNYSDKNKTDTHEASIRFMAVSELFDPEISERRYMFTHERFAIVRPQNLYGTFMTMNARSRVNNMVGVIAEKVSSTAMGKTVSAGDEITYTFYIFNTNAEPKDFSITDLVSPYTTFVSATDGGACTDGTVSWSIQVPADTRISVSYTVKVNSGIPRFTKIDGGQAKINGVSFMCFNTYVANTLTAAEQQKIVEAVKTVKGMDVTGLTSVQIANLIYKTAFGVDNIFGEQVTTYADLFNGSGVKNVGIFNDTTYWSDPNIYCLADSNPSNAATMVAPGMYGGKYVYDSGNYKEEYERYLHPIEKVTPFNLRRVRSRYYWEKDLVIGDIYLLRGETQESLYIYIGDDTFVSLGAGHELFSEQSVSERFRYTPATPWKYHAVLRPSIVLDI